MSIQSNINQLIGSSAILANLSPTLREMSAARSATRRANKGERTVSRLANAKYTGTPAEQEEKRAIVQQQIPGWKERTLEARQEAFNISPTQKNAQNLVNTSHKYMSDEEKEEIQAQYDPNFQGEYEDNYDIGQPIGMSFMGNQVTPEQANAMMAQKGATQINQRDKYDDFLDKLYKKARGGNE